MEPRAPGNLTTRGFFYPYRGFKFLFTHPGLLGYVAVPFAINTILYTGVVWFAGSRFGRWVDSLVPTGDAWYWSLLSYGLWVVFAAVLFLIVVYTFTLVGNLVLAPFNDLLSEKVESAYTGQRFEEPFRLGAFLADVKRSLLAELGRLALFGAGFLLLLALNLIPGLGTAVYGPVITVYTLFFLGWEYFDYSMERSRFGFGVKRRTAWRNVTVFLSFGAGTALLLLIPLLNFLAIPACVTGATLLFCDLRVAGRVPQDTGSASPPPEVR